MSHGFSEKDTDGPLSEDSIPQHGHCSLLWGLLACLCYEEDRRGGQLFPAVVAHAFKSHTRKEEPALCDYKSQASQGYKVSQSLNRGAGSPWLPPSPVTLTSTMLEYWDSFPSQILSLAHESSS